MIPRGKFLKHWRARTAARALNRAERRAVARRKRTKRVGALASAALITGSVIAPGVATAATVAPEDVEFFVTKHDLEFILEQIRISESHAMGGDLLCATPNDVSGSCVPDAKLPWGLRTVDGTSNNLMPGQSTFGASGQVFPRLTEPQWRDAEDLSFDPDGPQGPAQAGVPTSYRQTSGFVNDSEPRIISNLIVDQTATNPAAMAAIGTVDGAVEYDHDGSSETPNRVFIPNRSPDEGLSAPYNSWFTLFGQFFDHGLDLVSKGGSGTVAVPLQPDDPLYDHTPGARTNFIMLTRATNLPGPDGVLGTTDDVHEHTNRTTPYVDQNQTYTSHPSHQFFLREYRLEGGIPVPTGKLLDGVDVDGDGEGDGLATWADIKRQAREVLGIELDDLDVLNVPLVATDPYGRFVPGPNGMPQLVIAGTPNTLREGSLASPVDATQAMEAGHAFLDDISHYAAPLDSRGTPLAADADVVTSDPTDPTTAPVRAYDDELLAAHFITGDGRGNENIGLSAVHHVFHSEHNRLVQHIDEVIRATGDAEFIAQWEDRSGTWDYGERLFQAARFVTEMQYQHLVFEEFGRKIQPNIDAQPTNETAYHADIDPAVTAEFAHVVYRFGHSMLTDEVDRLGFGTESLTLLDAFLNPAEFTDGGRLTADQGAGAIIQGMTRQTGNAIDEFVDDTLRNELLGLPLDLAAINLARGRDTGMPSLQQVRKTFYEQSFDAALEPYESWEDFRLAMKHRASITNFVAAYGIHPTLEAARTVAEKRAAAEVLVQDAAFMDLPAAESGLDDVDFWMGGLAEKEPVFGGMLGTTFNYVFEAHMEDLQNADRFYYLNRTQGLNLLHQLEANSFSELAMRNTDASHLPGDLFAQPDLRFDLSDMTGSLPAGFSRMNDGTYRFDGAEHIVIDGTDGDDRMEGGLGDDTLWGHKGNDRMEGGVGNDVHHGGHGNDILQDKFGDDTIHAGSGDDAINAGSGLDLLFGQAGSDYILHTADPTTSFAGGGDDLVRGGNANDIITGNEGDDWLEGFGGHDLVQGDNALTFQNDPQGGADVLFGGSGNDDHDAEGGDDIMINNGIDRHAGMLGFDWVTHQGDPFAGRSDLGISIFQPDDASLMNSRYLSVEGLSGADHNDVLRGSSAQGDIRFADGRGNELTEAHLDRIVGFRRLLGGSQAPHAAPFLATNSGNDIILGGGGSDVVEGREGDDFLDGDAKLAVYLEGPGGERHTQMQPFQARVFDGTLSPADIRIVREIVTVTEAGVVDTAVYSGGTAEYEITENDDGTVTVAHVGAAGIDGVDTLRNIERLTFADGSVDLVPPVNTPATGTVDVSPTTPVQGQPLTATPAIADVDGIDQPTMSFTWQLETAPGEWAAAATANGSATFVPTEAEVGARLRVVVTFTDGKGTLETVTSGETSPVIGMSAPGAPTIGTATAGDARATVTWSAPADPGTSAITGYDVLVRSGGSVVRTVTGLQANAASTVIRGLTNGTRYTFTVRAVNAAGAGAESASTAAVTPVAPTAPTPPTPPVHGRSGYWMVQADGTVHGVGIGSLGSAPVGSATAEDIEPTPSGNGYWVVSSAGAVYAFGDAPYLGGAGRLERAEVVTGISSTPSGRGYWLFTSKGRVINKGDAGHFRDMAGTPLNGPVLDAIATPSGRGYYMVASDGGVFAFGDAQFAGSMGGRPLNAPVQSLVPDADGRGYWLVASDGGVFAFDAPFHGSMGGRALNAPITGMVGFGSEGYLMVAEDGGTFAFGTARFHGSLADRALTTPITSIAVRAD